MNLIHRFGLLFFPFFYCFEYFLDLNRILIISAHLVMMGNHIFSIFKALNLEENVSVSNLSGSILCMNSN